MTLSSACADDDCAGEVRALAIDVEPGKSLYPSFYPLSDWWFVAHYPEPHRVVSRCGDEVVELPGEVWPVAVPNTASALFCDASGLHRIDLDERGQITRLNEVARCEVGPADGAGGRFLVSDKQPSQPITVEGGPLYGDLNAIWRVPGLEGPSEPVKIHPSAQGPVELADGWYVLTNERTWSWLDLATNELVPRLEDAAFIVPSPGGEAWVWAQRASADGTSAYDTFVQHVDDGHNVALGPVAMNASIVWNETGTHLAVKSELYSSPYEIDTEDIFVLDAHTGARTATLAGADGWFSCGTSQQTHESGFLICRIELGSFDQETLHLDPVSGAVTPIKTSKRAKHPSRHENDTGYRPLSDGRYITGQSLAGYPRPISEFETIDRQQLILVDPETNTRTPLMTLYDTDKFMVSLEHATIAFSDAERDGFYLRPLPPKATP